MLNPANEAHIKINERTWEIPKELLTIAVQNDDSSETVLIDIPRNFDGIDRSGYDVYLRTVSDEGGMDESLFAEEDIELTEDFITAKWTLEPPKTSFPGVLRAYIVIRGADGYQWSTFEGRFTIKELANADPIIPGNLSLYDEWLRRIMEIGAEVAESAEIAEQSASSASASSSSAAYSAKEAYDSSRNAWTYANIAEDIQHEVEATATVVQTIGDAVKAGKSPIIGDNDNWFVWDTDRYVDSGISAHGKGDKGDKGDPGEPGEDGVTPVRGTDYWTEADKQGIIDDVLDALPAAEEASF